ncbi:MAG: ABC transporter ATP-binding protein [Armatimonadota bacterium]|nr:ABC transporter ATP-binding protein [bacterium]MDW8321592.1 ABC transporter ATP-binding protein [Armatimonadota bacterium]
MTTTPEPLVRFRDIQIGYGRQVVLDYVTLDVFRGDFFGLVGPNGSGKTTLLRCLLGILRPMRGQIIRAPSLRIGYVPQRETLDALFPLTALDIVLMGRYPHAGVFRSPQRADRELAMQCLQQVGMAHFAHRLYRDLSGGQRQRVLIARALAVEPILLVLDEPTNGLDLPTEAAILDLIERLHTEEGLTIVLVSHVLNVVARYATRLGVLLEGRLVTGEAEQLLQEQVLQEVYGVPVCVQRLNRHYIVTVREQVEECGDA